jgi:hypothetical protein
MFPEFPKRKKVIGGYICSKCEKRWRGTTWKEYWDEVEANQRIGLQKRLYCGDCNVPLKKSGN